MNFLKIFFVYVYKEDPNIFIGSLIKLFKKSGMAIEYNPKVQELFDLGVISGIKNKKRATVIDSIHKINELYKNDVTIVGLDGPSHYDRLSILNDLEEFIMTIGTSDNGWN